MLEGIGVEFNSDGAVSTVFFKNGKGMTNSPEVNGFIRDFVSARNALQKRVDPAGTGSDGEATTTFTFNEMRKNPAVAEYFGANDNIAKDRNGDLLQPIAILPKGEVIKLQKKRLGLIMESLAGVDDTGGLHNVGEPGKPRWKGGNLNKEQLQAILDLPDDVMSPRLKAHLKFIHEQIESGSSFHMDYNAATSNAKYSSRIQAQWMHVMPFSIEVTKAGNLVVKTISVDRIMSKLQRWRKDKKGRFLDLWDGHYGEFYHGLLQYMQNHREGKPGHTGLHADEKTAMLIKERYNELINVPKSEEFRTVTLEGSQASKKSGRPVSGRLDRVNNLRAHDGEPWSADYGKLMRNLLPADSPQQGRPPARWGEDPLMPETPPDPTRPPGRGGEQFLPAGEGAPAKTIDPEAGGKEGLLVPEETRGTTKRPPRIKELEDEAGHVDEMTKEGWDAKVEEHSPIRPVADEDLPTLGQLRIMDKALSLRDDDGNPLILNRNQIVDVAKPQHGAVVRDARIDIESVRRGKEQGMNIHAIAVKGEDGKTMYTGHLLLDPIEKGGRVELHYGRGQAKTAERMLRTAQGERKTTFAFVDGRVNNYNTPTPTELKRRNKAGERVWTQVGFNPTRHGYYYNKHDQSMKVESGDRVLMAGNTVYVRNAKQVKAEKVPGLVRMGRGEGAGPEVRYMPAGDRHAINIIKGTESPEGLPAKPTILDLARYFQDRFDDPIDFKKSTPEQWERFESSVYDEVKHAMEIHPEAKGWYDENLGLAMSVLRELDPAIAKTENDFFFKAFLAVTSDGNKVDPQFKQAWKTYEHWKETGEITGDFVSGDRITNIRNNLKLIDAVSKKLGPKKAAEWLTRKGTVKELREAAINDLGFTPKEAKKLGTGENVDAIIPFASIFGPKLGSFFNNLYGDYSTVTMDRWFMRTIGRNTGTQVKDPTTKQVKDAKNRLRLAVDMLTPAERKALGITKAALKGEGYIDASKKLGVHFTIKKNRENVSAAVNEVRLSANAIAKMQKPLVEAPQGGGHRKWIRDRINAVQKRLKADGVELENADLQALLWYNEKELYKSAGVRGPKGANDYASAAESLHAAIRGRPSESFAGGAGRVGGIGRGKGDSKLGKPAVDPSGSYMPAGGELRHKGTDLPPEKITNPVDPSLPRRQKVLALEELSKENEPLIARVVGEIKDLGLFAKHSLKEHQKIYDKSKRPEILSDRPWFDVEHVRDSLRLKTRLESFDDLASIGEVFRRNGLEVVEIDFRKMMDPKEWGWRMVAVDLRMPNGQLVEWYAPLKELDQKPVKDPNHVLFEKWRDKSDEYRSKHKDQFMRDMDESNARYSQAWDAALSRLGMDSKAARASMSKAFESFSSKTGSKLSLSSSAVGASPSLPKDQTPARRRPKTGKRQAMTSSRSGSIENLRSDISTSGFSGKSAKKSKAKRHKDIDKELRIERDLKKQKRNK